MYGINELGTQIIGTYVDGDNGFIYSGGTFTTVDFMAFWCPSLRHWSASRSHRWSGAGLYFSAASEHAGEGEMLPIHFSASRPASGALGRLSRWNGKDMHFVHPIRYGALPDI